MTFLGGVERMWISCQRCLHHRCLLVQTSQTFMWLHMFLIWFQHISPHCSFICIHHTQLVQVFILSSNEDMKRYLETFEVWKAFERTLELKAFVVSLERTPNVRASLLSDLLRHSRWAPCSLTPQRPSIRVLWCSRLRDTYIILTFLKSLTTYHTAVSYSMFSFWPLMSSQLFQFITFHMRILHQYGSNPFSVSRCLPPHSRYIHIDIQFDAYS